MPQLGCLARFFNRYKSVKIQLKMEQKFFAPF